MAPGDTVAVLPIVNYTETPQAGLRAEAIAESLLKTGGVDRPEALPGLSEPGNAVRAGRGANRWARRWNGPAASAPATR